MSNRDLALDLFKAFKNTAIKKTSKTNRSNLSTPSTQAGKAGDPELISGVLSNLISDREWDSGLAEGNLFAGWASIVGGDIATHTEPISLLDGKLLVQCSSTAWATQLTLTQNDILATIRASAPGALVESIRFIGPQAPSWKKGLRSISNGRGPRDTYG